MKLVVSSENGHVFASNLLQLYQLGQSTNKHIQKSCDTAAVCWSDVLHYTKLTVNTLKHDYTVNMNSDGQIVAASKPFHFIGKKEDIIQAGRVVKSVGDRDVLVLYHQGDFYAIDVRCYHAGGPLHKGDIEEFDGRSCIVCPWHKYKITLAEGEGLYQAVDPSVKPLKPTWCSKGVKQRVHTVTESNGDLLLTLNDSAGAIDSDHYQTEKYRDTFMKEGTKKGK